MEEGDGRESTENREELLEAEPSRLCYVLQLSNEQQTRHTGGLIGCVYACGETEGPVRGETREVDNRNYSYTFSIG